MSQAGELKNAAQFALARGARLASVLPEQLIDRHATAPVFTYKPGRTRPRREPEPSAVHWQSRRHASHADSLFPYASVRGSPWITPSWTSTVTCSTARTCPSG